MTPIYITDNGNIQVGEDIYPTGDLVGAYVFDIADITGIDFMDCRVFGIRV